MHVSLKQINDEVVKPTKFQVGNGDERPIKGENLFSELYANIFTLGKKKSGKTTVINKIVKDCSTKETTVIVIASTVDKDIEYKAMKAYCDRKGIEFQGYTSMKEDDVNVLDALITKLQREAAQIDDMDVEPNKQQGLGLFEDEDDEDGKKPKKPKYRAPRYIIIFDDISNELRSPILVKLMKMNRHFLLKLCINSQYCNDLLPSQLRQLDYCLVFKNETEDKLMKLHKDLDLALDFSVFLNLYHNATHDKFNFFYIDVRNEKYRKNFNYEYKLSKV